MGIEPTYQAWKASVLPLNYARNINKKLFPVRRQGQEDNTCTRASALHQSMGIAPIPRAFFHHGYHMVGALLTPLPTSPLQPVRT